MNRKLLLAVLSAALVLGTTVSAQVNFTLSQPAVSNLFSGPLGLTLSGLNIGETVVLQKFMDANDNGQVDAGEPLLGQFVLTEGQVTSLGGVRNKSVPGDTDGTANGTITETIDFSDPRDFQHHVASYVFRASSPAGRFTNDVRFAVTNSTLGQGVTGTVSGAPNAFIILLKATSDGAEPFAGGIANGAGGFSISCPPGDYQVLATKNGMVTDFGSAPMVTVGAGSSANVTISLSPANQTITGTLTNTAGGVLPGVQLRLQSATGLFVLGYSDSQGHFSLPVTAGVWSPEVEDAALPLLGMVGTEQLPEIDTTGGSVAGVVLGLQPATALFYGNFRDGANQAGITNIPISANLQQNSLRSSGMTDADGYYTVGVVAGMWNLGPSDKALLERGILANGTNTTITAGQAVRVDFTSRVVTAHLTGRVVDNFGVPLTNFTLVVQPVPLVSSGAGSYYPATDAQGNFDVGLSGGTWNIALESERTAASNLVSFSVDLVVQDNVNQTGLNFVAYRATQQITGFVRDGATGVTNVQMYGGAAINGTNYLTGASYTDGGGNYVLKVVNASWNVSLNNGDLNRRGFRSENNQTVPINNADGVANFSLTRYSNLVTLTNASHQGSVFNALVLGEPGRAYVVEVTTNVRNPVSWTPVTTNVQNGPNFPFSDNQAAVGPRYYRARIQP